MLLPLALGIFAFFLTASVFTTASILTRWPASPLEPIAKEWLNESLPASICDEYNSRAEASYYIVIPNFIILTGDTENDNKNSVVTVSTHFTFDRRQRLIPLTEHWTGPISAVFYGTSEEAEKLKSHLLLQKFKLSKSMRPNIAVHHVILRNETDLRLYPTNILRNIASRYVRTRFEIPLDIDLLPRQGIYERMSEFLLKNSSDNVDASFSTQNSSVAAASAPVVVAYIIPTFDTDANVTLSQFLDTFPTNKSELLRLWKKIPPFLRPFNFRLWYCLGHWPTNFARWANASDAYRVDYQWMFEPNMIVQNDATPDRPQFDERGVGYGFDKLSLAARLAAHHRNMRFVVLPDEFLIHASHPASRALGATWLREPYYTCIERYLYALKMDLVKMDEKFFDKFAAMSAEKCFRSNL